MKNIRRYTKGGAAAIMFLWLQWGGVVSPAKDACDQSQLAAFTEQALPLWTGDITPNTQWRACARVLDPWGPERRVCVTKLYDGHASMDFAQARGGKLSDQFCKLKASFPGLGLKELASRASIVGPIRIPSSASVDALAVALEKLKVPLELPNVLVVDHPTYQMELRTQYGSEVRLTLTDAPPNDALVSWVDRAIHLTGPANQKAGSPGQW